MLLLAAALAAQAPGPSFPCEQAAIPQEKLVCSRRTLAKADLELDIAYRKALARLSPEGRRQLRLSQRAWLRFRQTVCPPGRSKPAHHRSTESCLETRYVQRTDELNRAVRRIGPFQVLRLDGYRVWPEPGSSGWYDGFVTNEERFDWIDADSVAPELRAAARAWNAGLRNRPTTAGGRWFQYRRARREGDVGTDYAVSNTGRDVEILSASSDAIVSRRMDYWTGSAHPYEVISYETRLIRERRAMRFGDLLTRPRDWGRFAKRRVMAIPPMKGIADWPGLEERATDPGSLIALPAGLRVSFGQPLGRPSGEVALELSWAEVEPYLSPGGRRLAAGFRRQRR